MNLRRDDDEQPRERQIGPDGSSGPSAALILSGVLAALVVIFVVQNANGVPVKFLWIDQELKLWVVIVGSLVIGALLDRLVTVWRRRSRRDH